MTIKAPPFVPACMDADELASWTGTNKHMTPNRAAGPCSDCTLGFAAEMRAAGRCNGTPKGIEENEGMDGNGSMAALTTALDAVAPVASAISGHAAIARSVPLEVEAPPCGSCAHEPVCSLRQAVEKLGLIETTAPLLPEGLRLALVAAIACDYYARDRAKPAPVRALTSQERGAANRNAALGPGRIVSEETRERMRQAQIRVMAERRRQKLVAAGAPVISAGAGE